MDRIVEVEFGGNLDISLQVLRPGGLISAYASEAVPEPVLPFYRMMYHSIRLQHILTFQMPEEEERRAVEEISTGLADGGLTHHVGEIFALKDVVSVQ